ncbi:MAG: HPF/RaiA family ribosome-associated protein [Alphaproteobacteria bacterium]|nr:HPF/RaiA family ribosome-associated protein [Alphaproteobacteria bacterium]
MQLPIQITFRKMAPSPAVEAHIRERAADLERFFGRIMACRVVVEASTRRQRQGNIYHLRIDLTVPGREIVVRRDPPEHHAHEDILVAVRDAFDAARRQLEDHARAVRGDVKSHETPDHGRVVRLFPDYGFIRVNDGSEVYMHRNAVVGDGFDRLVEGDEVRFVLQEGEMGPQASTVVPIGKHHLVP